MKLKKKLNNYIALIKETRHYLLNPRGIHYLLEDVELAQAHAEDYWKLYCEKVEDTPKYQAMAKETAARKAAMDEMEEMFEFDLDMMEQQYEANVKELTDRLAAAYAQNAELNARIAALIARG